MHLKLERLVASQPNQGGQGYAVVELSADVLTDLTSARMEVESTVLSQSVTHGSPEWEAEVVGSHHLLSRLPVPRAGASDNDVAQWTDRHETFHRTLLAGCPSKRLLDIALSLRQEAELYRRWSVPMTHDERDVQAEHREIVDAALARDADMASALLRRHLATTKEHLLSSRIHGAVLAASLLDPQRPAN